VFKSSVLLLIHTLHMHDEEMLEAASESQCFLRMTADNPLPRRHHSSLALTTQCPSPGHTVLPSWTISVVLQAPLTQVIPKPASPSSNRDLVCALVKQSPTFSSNLQYTNDSSRLTT
jgi:hypothetical protein